MAQTSLGEPGGCSAPPSSYPFLSPSAFHVCLRDTASPGRPTLENAARNAPGTSRGRVERAPMTPRAALLRWQGLGAPARPWAQGSGRRRGPAGRPAWDVWGGARTQGAWLRDVFSF